MERWEDQIDVDDSDLQSLLHPFPFPSSSSLQAPSRSLQPCSQIPRSSQNVDHGSSVLPPYWQSQNASQLQDSNRNQGGEDLSKATAFGIQIPGPAGAVQAAMRRKSAAAVAQSPPALEAGGYCHVLDVNEEDEDFKLNPWLCALNFLENGPDSTTTSPISSIIAQQSATERIPQVVGIVESCKSNGLGGLILLLKDPTGTIGATVHHKVLLEGEIGAEISVGCVLILKQVVAFSPSRSVCYLNVTLKNLVKLIPKDCGAPEKQIMPSFSIKSTAELNGKEMYIELPEQGRPVPPGKHAKMSDDDERSSCFNRGRMPEVAKGLFSCGIPCSINAGTPTANTAAKPGTKIVEPNKLPISRASSAAEWTDEQLEKLFSDYDD